MIDALVNLLPYLAEEGTLCVLADYRIIHEEILYDVNLDGILE